MNFWSDKRIWVTGATGSLGQVIARKREARGCRAVFAAGHTDGDFTDSAATRNLLAPVAR